MTAEDLPDRPADLGRRRPRPAPDERVDPVDYVQPELPQSSVDEVSMTPEKPQPRATTSPASGAAPISRRNTALPFSTRLAPDVLDLIDRASASGEGGGKIRGVVEKAIRDTYADLYGRR
ncbi:hypothetical protein HA387_01015 [Clavibacter michiganensis subsp. michiganensis]|uniref:hypothetical protein n=1 Tax=Clavibacter michiganensis TaxID=28447 RepID=UPI00186765E5|nr:hypothetical protein [Clavibacter michiganensis]MBE3077006.1 hypothetical protein [Clavibacter michiganensis subsp. michiganensis]